MSKFFIEIGTSDFDTFEHLAEEGWKGIFVEPVKHLLDNLKRYDGCIYVNAAILTENKLTNVHSLKSPKEWWQNGIGFTTEAPSVSNHFWDELREQGCEAKTYEEFLDWCETSEKILVNEVEGITLDTLIDKYDVKHIDYLKIDIEGMEHAVLNSYSWSIKPKMLKVEWCHWPSIGISVEEYIKTLENMGYEVKVEEKDLVAVLNE